MNNMEKDIESILVAYKSSHKISLDKCLKMIIEVFRKRKQRYKHKR